MHHGLNYYSTYNEVHHISATLVTDFSIILKIVYKICNIKIITIRVELQTDGAH